MKTVKTPWLSLILAIGLLFTASCNGKVTPTAAPSTGVPPAAQTAPAVQVPAATESATQPAASSTPEILLPPAQKYPWWNDTVFYEIFVRSFMDSDGDGIGDINGLTSVLDYLNDGDPATTTDLGITGIWLMPINPSPSYHGYDVTDYYDINPEYGTKEDFKNLLQEAHQRGIKVIIDLVINHTSSAHPWFQASKAGDPKYRDWYIWSKTNPGYLGPWSQQVWHQAGGSYYYGIFWSEMPDLNLANPEVTAEIDNVTRFWLEDMGVDGFRLDAARHYIEQGRGQENTPATHTWLQHFFQLKKQINPEAFSVGEIWTSTEQILEYIGDEVDIAFEFDLALSFLTAARGPIAASLKEQMQHVLTSYPAGQYAVFLTNHDQDRVMSTLKDEKSARLAATMYLTSPGVPFIYYGEEIGMTGVKPDEDIRLPMKWNNEFGSGFSSGTPWRAISKDNPEWNVADQLADPDSLLRHYRKLIQLRNEHAALRTGEAVLVDAGTHRLYAMLRYNDDEAFLILVNVHPQPLTDEVYSLNLPAGLPFAGELQATSVLGQSNPSAPILNSLGGFTDYKPFPVISAKSSVIIQLKPK